MPKQLPGPSARSRQGHAALLAAVVRRACLLLACAVGLAGCGRDRARTASADSGLNRDLTLAGAANTTRPPVTGGLGDTATTAPAARQEPTRTAPERPVEAPRAGGQRPVARRDAPVRPPVRAPAPPAPAPATSVASAPAVAASAATAGADSAGAAPTRGPAPSLGTGTMLVARTTAAMCSLANRPGDKVVATLTEDVIGANGARLPAGTPVLVEMAVPTPPATFAFRVRGVQVDGHLLPVEGTVVTDGADSSRRVAKGGDKGKVITGAIAGAILGRVLGGGGAKGTVIGAAGGAAAGSVMAARNSTVEHCLGAGATLSVTLAAPLVLAGSSP